MDAFGDTVSGWEGREGAHSHQRPRVLTGALSMQVGGRKHPPGLGLRARLVRVAMPLCAGGPGGKRSDGYTWRFGARGGLKGVWRHQ